MGWCAATSVRPGRAVCGPGPDRHPARKRLSRVLGQAAHLLTPTDPPHSLIDILYSRVSHDPEWGAQAQALTAGRKLPG